MANNTVTVSGMFGEVNGQIHTYFADSPVLINISGLEWPTDGNGKPTSPFNIVRIEVLPHEASMSELEQMFPDSNAPFYTKDQGYINGAVWLNVRIRRTAYYVLIVTEYSKSGRFPPQKYAQYREYLEQAQDVRQVYDLDAEGSQGMKNLVVGVYRVKDTAIDQLDILLQNLLDLCHRYYNYDDMKVIGDFRADTGGQESIIFDISSALRAMWANYSYDGEVYAATLAANSDSKQYAIRRMQEYLLRIYTEYLSADNVFTTTQCQDKDGNTDIPGGQCLIGGMTEWERSLVTDMAYADVSSLEHTGVRNGDASTKPISSPETVGRDSITSWVDVQQGYTKSIFYPASFIPDDDDVEGSQTGWTGHAPLVLRDSIPYVDFLFKNRRGALETCSAQMKESMDIDVDMQQYAQVERPTFRPSQSLIAIGSDGRRSWQMSSGYVTREWAEWWTMEFLGGKRKMWWMLYKGAYVPVIIKPAKSSTTIYDRAKQEMPHVDFTVTLALEG